MSPLQAAVLLQNEGCSAICQNGQTLLWILDRHETSDLPWNYRTS